jgi:Ca2+-binding RTX toxin-like protein
MYGGLGNDELQGRGGNDHLYGNAGNDRIWGGDGHDYIEAGVGNDYINGGSGSDTLGFEGNESDYTRTKTSKGWNITSKFGDVTTVVNVEYFKFGSTRRYVNSNIENAEVFFDANLNGVRDPNEPFAMTEADGSFNLEINLEEYDLNYNGVLDPTEGLIIGQGGTYVSSGLPVETSMSAIPGSEMVTPLTTLVAELTMQGIEPEAAETQVKLALGLPEDIDLGTFNYLDAAANGDPNGLKVYSAVVQVQNTIVTATKLLEGAAADASAQIANGTVKAIVSQIQSNQPLDLSQSETLQTILDSTISTVTQLDTEIDTTQLSQVSAIAVETMAQSNQLIQETAESEGALNELATNITRIQKVALGDVANSLSQLAAGTKTVEEFAAETTPEAIQAKLAATVVSDPTFRPEVVEDASEENIVSEENVVEDAESSTANTSGSNQTGSSNEQFIGSIMGSGSGSASDSNSFDVSNSIPEIISPVQPTMAEMTTSVTEATVESDLIMGNGVDPMYLLDGDDTLMADSQDNWVNGNTGNDMMDVGAGNDTVYGGQDNDTVFGAAGNDWINGNKGADFLDGGEGIDTLYGGEDSDTLQGQAGNDWLSGNKGADFLDGGAGADILFGGQDEDTLQGGSNNDELFGNIGADLMEGNEGNDLLHGGQDNDTLSGNNGDDTIHGDRGNDILNGGEGDDQLIGGSGNDILFGAAGADTLTGGAGQDQFILTVASSNIITDFTDGEDVIVLEEDLTFEQLTIENSQNATLVKLNNEILATLNGVESSLITADDFNSTLV